MVISYLLPSLLSALLEDTRELGLVGCLGIGWEIISPNFPWGRPQHKSQFYLVF